MSGSHTSEAHSDDQSDDQSEDQSDGHSDDHRQHITLYGNPVLRQRATPVVSFDQGIEDLVGELFDTMYSIDIGVGLAANQIGRPESVFVFDCHDGVPGHVVNPSVEPIGEDLQDGWEGCLSLPGVDLRTTRYLLCRVTGEDMYGERISYEGEGIRARCFQHETDHLRGVLYVDLHPVRVRKKLEREMKSMEWYGNQSLDPLSKAYRDAQSDDSDPQSED
jgi:peptide deformylase